MSKIFLLMTLLFSTYLAAKEPMLALLQSVHSNTQQHFKISNQSFVCHAYGIIGLEYLMQKSKLDSICKKSIERFFVKNPYAKEFTLRNLELMQRYHIDLKQDGCVLFASGKRTLGELLLREGLALVKPDFKDREYNSLYKNAQLNAKLEKNGVWKEEVRRECIVNIYE